MIRLRSNAGVEFIGLTQTNLDAINAGRPLQLDLSSHPDTGEPLGPTAEVIVFKADRRAVSEIARMVDMPLEEMLAKIGEEIP